MYEVEARKLLDFRRLDIALKIKFIEEYVNRTGEKYRKFYLQSIKFRTGFIEDEKNNAQDFIRDFEKLIDSISNSGYRKEEPIKISACNGLNVTGAHRLACAIYFNEIITVEEVNTAGLEWGECWFLEYGFTRTIIDELKYTIMEYSLEYNSMILWGSAGEQLELVRNFIVEKYNIETIELVSVIDQLEPHQFEEVVKDIYSIDYGINTSSSIKDKAYELSKRDCRNLFLLALKITEQNKLVKIKEELRNSFFFEGLGKYNICHTSDSIETAMLTFSYFLSENNKKRLTQRKYPSKSLLNWLAGLEIKLKDLEINKNDICIVGSSTMDVLGIRESTDVDFIVESGVRSKNFDDDVTALDDYFDVASKGYLRLWGGKKTDDYILKSINEHFYFRGFKFIDVTSVRERKYKQCRKKDIQDVKLIDEWMRGEDLPNSSPNKFKYLLIGQVRYLKSRAKERLKRLLPDRIVKLVVSAKKKLKII